MLQVVALVVLLLLFSTTLPVLSQIDGFDKGSWNTEFLDIGSIKAPLASLSPYHLYIRYPTTCNSQCGPFRTGGIPVLLFVSGFAGSLHANNYDVVLNGIAQHGIIVVAVDQDLTGFALTLDMNKFGVQLQRVIAYIQSPTGLLPQIRSPGLGKKPFVNTGNLYLGGSKIFYGGHSSGAHIALQNVVDLVDKSGACPSEVGGFVFLSPLDGQDPLGFGGDFAIYRGKMLKFASPALVVSGSLDGQSVDLVSGIPCVPDDRGNLHFYRGWTGFMQYIEALGMGALDILDESVSTSYDQFCAGSNKTRDAASRAAYRVMAKGAIVSFIQAVVGNDADALKKLQTQTDLAVPLSLLQRNDGTANLGCSFVPNEETMSAELQQGIILFVVFFTITFVSGLLCFFRRMDADTMHRYHEAGAVGDVSSYQTKLEPSYMQQPSMDYGKSMDYSQQYGQQQPSMRAPSINV